MEDFSDLIAGWQLAVTLQMRTPLKWLQRHMEFQEGSERPTEPLPAEYATWVPVPFTWREAGIDEDDRPPSTVASQIGPVPMDGAEFLPFLIEYRMIVEGAIDALRDLGVRYPAYSELLTPPPRRNAAPQSRG